MRCLTMTCVALGLMLGAGCSDRNPLFIDDGGVEHDGHLPADKGADDGAILPDGGPSHCTTNDQCGAGMYCKLQSCSTGACEVRPNACTEHLAPVCGCDGQTYDNACHAASAGVSVAAPGPCTVEKDCDQLNQDYIAAVQKAKQCAPMLPVVQCLVQVDSAIHCGCPTYVEQANTPAIKLLKQIRQKFDNQGCVPWLCGMPCMEPTPGNCMPGPSGMSGSCE